MPSPGEPNPPDERTKSANSTKSPFAHYVRGCEEADDGVTEGRECGTGR